MCNSLRSKMPHSAQYADLVLDKDRPAHSAKVQEAHSKRSLTEKLLQEAKESTGETTGEATDE